MEDKLKVSKTGTSHTTAIVTGGVIALLISVFLTALAANFILNGHFSEKSAVAVIFVIRTISLLVGALIGASLLKQNYLKVVAIIAAEYLIALVGMGIVFFDGSFKNFLLGTVSVVIGGVAALLILQAPKSNRLKLKKLAR